MFTILRGRCVGRLRRLGAVDRKPGDPHDAVHGMFKLDQHAIAGNLRMLHHVSVVGHLRAENVCLMQHLQPVRCGSAHEYIGQCSLHFAAVDDPLRGAGEAWVGDPFLVAQYCAQRGPAVAVVGRDHQPAVFGLEGFVGG
ncbi:hypothetical protein D3C84_186370 [compost metagenome]